MESGQRPYVSCTEPTRRIHFVLWRPVTLPPASMDKES